MRGVMIEKSALPEREGAFCLSFNILFAVSKYNHYLVQGVCGIHKRQIPPPLIKITHTYLYPMSILHIPMWRLVAVPIPMSWARCWAIAIAIRSSVSPCRYTPILRVVWELWVHNQPSFPTKKSTRRSLNKFRASVLYHFQKKLLSLRTFPPRAKE